MQAYAIPIRTGQATGQAVGTSSTSAEGRGLIIREATETAAGAATVNGVANYDPHFSKVALFMPGEFSDGAAPLDLSRYRRILTTDGGAQVVNDDSPDGVVGSVRCWRQAFPGFSGAVVASAGSVPPEMNITGRTFTFETFCRFTAVGAEVVVTYGQRGDVFAIGKSVTYEYGVWSEGMRVFLSDPYTVIAQFTCGSPCGIPRGIPCGIPCNSPFGSPCGIPRGIPCGSPCGIPCGSPCGIPGNSACGIPCGSQLNVADLPICEPLRHVESFNAAGVRHQMLHLVRTPDGKQPNHSVVPFRGPQGP